jgi:hypothetical protein
MQACDAQTAAQQRDATTAFAYSGYAQLVNVPQHVHQLSSEIEALRRLSTVNSKVQPL